MKIGILQTGHALAPIVAKHGDFDALFMQLLANQEFRFRSYTVLEGEFPNSVTECDGWLVTGSRHSVYEDLPWISLLETFLRNAFDANVPIVGVCFGHQILAQALGGRVEKFSGGWSIGPHEYQFDGMDSPVIINAWHQDQVTELPVGACAVGRSDFCANAAIAYGNRAYTVQAHPEFQNDFLADLIDARRAVVPANLACEAEEKLKSLSPSAVVVVQIVSFSKPEIMLWYQSNNQEPRNTVQGLQKIIAPRQRLAELVYEQILAGLQSGELNPDYRLHQERLAELLSVSRTPVREALLRLEQEGILVSTNNGGFEIRKISEKDVRDIYQSRQAIEGFCAGLLAQTVDTVSLQKLREIIIEQEQTTAETNHAYYEANRITHRAFVEATGNSYLLESFDALWNRSISMFNFQTLDKPRLAASLVGHMVLCDAIASGNFEQAQNVMHQHIAEGCLLQLSTI